MKKLFLCIVLLVCISGMSLFAWEPEDFTKFPICMDEDSWIANLGVGIHFPYGFGNNDLVWIPPLRFTLDKNIPISNLRLPFFIGGLASYNGEGRKNGWHTHKLTTGARLGYHFRFDVERLDVYAVTTAGWTFLIHTGSNSPHRHSNGEFYYSVKLGARFFITDNFGFWAEGGYSPLSYFDIGISLKF